MSPSHFTESDIEQVAHGPDIAPDTPNAEHEELNEMVPGDDHI